MVAGVDELRMEAVDELSWERIGERLQTFLDELAGTAATGLPASADPAVPA